jgi:hypothetical protein
LNEQIPLLKAETRLSSNLADDSLEEALLLDIANKGARRVRKDTLSLIDPMDARKDFAKKMGRLVVVRGFGKEPPTLLTNVELKQIRKSLRFVVGGLLRGRPEPRLQEPVIRVAKTDNTGSSIPSEEMGKLQSS